MNGLILGALLATMLLVCCSCTLADKAPNASSAQDCVILLHGMGRTSYSMNKIAAHLRAMGYSVWNDGYASLSEPIATLSEKTLTAALQSCRQHSPVKIHFVTHSLGGILLRHYLQNHSIDELDKIVMLSPPNHGSEVVDTYRDNWLFRITMGPAFLELSTDGLVENLHRIPGTIGIITGNVSSDPWFSESIPGPDDGKVSVESAKLPEMADFLVLPVGHTFIMTDKTAIHQIEYFLQRGSFEEDIAQSDTVENE